MKRILFLAFVLTAFVLNVRAQGPKLGHIDSAELIQMMPQTKQADSTLRRFAESLDGQMKTMTAEYQGKLQTYQSKLDSMPEAIRATKQQELQDLGTRIQDFQQSAQESIQKKKEELYSPILKKAEDAIKEVAKEKAYSYIFDTSVGAVLYSTEGDDILPLVKARLGIK